MFAEIFWRLLDDFLELFNGDNCRDAVVIESFGEGSFDFAGELRDVGFRRMKKNIAALDVSFNFSKTELFEAGLEVGHFDDVVAADINAAKEGEVVRHSMVKGNFF